MIILATNPKYKSLNHTDICFFIIRDEIVCHEHQKRALKTCFRSFETPWVEVLMMGKKMQKTDITRPGFEPVTYGSRIQRLTRYLYVQQNLPLVLRAILLVRWFF